MINKTKIGNIPLAMNIARTKDYILPCEERVFFDWLVIQQIYNGLGTPFYKSKSNIENELGIKRRVAERIEKRFNAIGILHMGLNYNPLLKNGCKVMFYSVSFEAIKQTLGQFIDIKSEYYKLVFEWFTMLAKEQKKAIKEATQKEKKSLPTKASDEVIKLYNTLCETYKNRVRIHNESPKYKTAKSVVLLPKSNTDLAVLQTLLNAYNEDTINKAFIVYADEVLKGERSEVKNHIKKFAYHDIFTNSFTTFEDCLCKFMGNYSYDK